MLHRLTDEAPPVVGEAQKGGHVLTEVIYDLPFNVLLGSNLRQSEVIFKIFDMNYDQWWGQSITCSDWCEKIYTLTEPARDY